MRALLQKAHGWSDKALQAAAEQLQLSPAVAGMIERGPAELIEVRLLNAHILLACSPAVAARTLTP